MKLTRALKTNGAERPVGKAMRKAMKKPKSSRPIRSSGAIEKKLSAKKFSKEEGKSSKAQATDSDLKLLPKELVLEIHDLMVKSRVLEERLIKIYKVGHAYFWIGGPGEEAWGVPLGLLVNKGPTLKHDFLHFHYRATPTLVAMGMPMIDSIRLIMNKATDPSTGGRNFSNHYCYPKWNVAPVSSPIEIQYSIALGTARAQKRAGGSGVSIITGGDAGTAEGDFASCLVWASRKGNELPMLISVQNNKWGISTEYSGQHGESAIADRERGFNIRSRVINGNDPIESYLCLKEELEYIRKTGKPSFIEAMLSRLYGHSSATGANLITTEDDCLKVFEERILRANLISESKVKAIWDAYEKEGSDAQQMVKDEPVPISESVWDHVYFGNENADWRKF